MQYAHEKLIYLRGVKSRKEVLRDIGVGEYTLISYEQGRRIHRDEIKVNVPNYYIVSIDWLFLAT
ncbi:XRE family transcriptional regulator [Jeotgalibacillus marinus]|uniref:XRE family transcriptional regulator n=1 Tax=Jeotgalibacillus marinus TaxID=86667 RepID=A0ABV3Q601_9BACL